MTFSNKIQMSVCQNVYCLGKNKIDFYSGSSERPSYTQYSLGGPFETYFHFLFIYSIKTKQIDYYDKTQFYNYKMYVGTILHYCILFCSAFFILFFIPSSGD